MRYAVIDVETTGLNPHSAIVLELGIVIDDVKWWGEDVSELPTFHTYIKPPEIFPSQLEAAVINAELFKKIQDAGDLAQPEQNITNLVWQFLDSQGLRDVGQGEKITFNVAGKNPRFDMSFLECMPNWTSRLRARHRVLDPGILFAEENDEKIPNLQECWNRAFPERPLTVPHTAVEDAQITARVLRVGLMRQWNMI